MAVPVLKKRDGASIIDPDISIRSFLDCAQDAVVICNERGTIVLASARAEKLFGYGREELQGQEVEILFPERLRDKHRIHRSNRTSDAYLRSTADGSQLSGRLKDGTEFPAEISLSPIETDSGILIVSTIRDVTLSQKVNELHAYLASIVNSTNDAVIGKNLDGTVRFWNYSAERMFGYSASEIIGRPITILIPPEEYHQSVELLERVRRGETVVGFETERVRKGGERFSVSLTISPVRDANGKIVGVSKIARDVTQQKQAERALQRANQDLVQFAYAAAHDLQEPLRTISLSLGMLKRVSPEYPWPGLSGKAEAEELIDACIGGVRHMICMVKDLLAFTRITDDADRDGTTVVDSNAILQLVLTSFGRKVDDARITYGELPKLRIAATHLVQLLQNLIGNALKYRKQNRTSVIDISVTRQGDAWVFAIADNGIGLDPVYAERIFGIFKRLHHRDEYPGTGIGLALCERIVTSYGGHIWAECQPGMGATFKFTLPAMDTAPRQTPVPKLL